MIRPYKIVSSLYFFSLALVVISLPLSKYFMSVSQFCLGGVFIIEGIRWKKVLEFYSKKNTFKKFLVFIPFHFKLIVNSIVFQFKKFSQNKLAMIFCSIYLIYLIGLLYTDDYSHAITIIRTSLPLFVFPVVLSTLKPLSENRTRQILLLFVLSVFVGTLISIYFFLFKTYDNIREISPFICHIRFATLVNIAIFIIYYFLFFQDKKFPQIVKSFAFILLLWLISYLFILKSITGIVIFFILLILSSILYIRREKTGKYNFFLLTFIIPLFVLFYLIFCVIKFYDVEKIDFQNLDKRTANSNLYYNKYKNKTLENGHYVYVYICEKELKQEWNKISSYKYSGVDKKGQKIKYTLIRYLTSKGYRKDAEGVKKLTKQDVELIENGYSNYIFKNKYGLYPRIYQLIWQMDVYFKTGDPSGFSFAQRLESIKMGLGIIKENFFFGVGTGDLYNAYQRQYNITKSKLKRENRITGANQFLNFFVSFGLIGFLIIMFAMIYPAYKNKSFNDYLFLMFFIIAIISMFGEDTLKFQSGVTYFAFFYSFFVFAQKKNYRL
ncbi:MAG: O-antigen ligase family protein [Bacteroidales bacterium]|nr:O-antigen ligase family protein [Bacteroidales bacterium]